MSATKHDSVVLPAPSDAVFQAALGVFQNMGNVRLLAAHNSGRRLIVRHKTKLGGPRIIVVRVVDETQGSQIYVGVMRDPRAPKALLDGKFNEKALATYLEDVQGALDGTKPAPATPVTDHFVVKKGEQPWIDPEQEPPIEMGKTLLAWYGQ